MFIDGLSRASKLISAIIHIFIILIMVVGIPIMPKKTLHKENIIVVELMSISQKTNVKTKQHIDKKSIKKTAVKKDMKPSAPKTIKEISKADIKPKEQIKNNKEVLPKETNKVNKKAKQEPKKVVEKKTDIPKKEDLDDFDSLLKTVDKMEKQIESENKAKKSSDKSLAKSNVNLFNPEEDLSLSEEDYIRQKVSQNWSIPAGMYGIENIKINLLIKFSPDGTVKNIEIKNNILNTSDIRYKVAIESAQRAILKASPFNELPKEKYKNWQEYEFLFDPSQMIY